MNEINLASAENAKKINQRFRELEAEVRRLQEGLQFANNSIGTLQNTLTQQMDLFQKFFVNQYGTGPTERSENERRIPRIPASKKV